MGMPRRQPAAQCFGVSAMFTRILCSGNDQVALDPCPSDFQLSVYVVCLQFFNWKVLFRDLRAERPAPARGPARVRGLFL